MEDIKLPKRSDSIYKEIENFEDYEYSYCVAYELAIRNSNIRNLVEKYLKIGFDSFYIKESDNDIKLLKDYGFNYEAMINTEVLQVFKEEINLFSKISTNTVYTNDILKNNTINNALVYYKKDNFFLIDFEDKSFIPNKINNNDINKDYIHTLRFNLKRPKLYLQENKIFKVAINLNLPKDELITYISKIKDEFDNDKSIIKTPLELLGEDFEYLENKNIKQNSNKLNKKLIADKFFVYDYVTARKQQVEEMNNQIVEEYEDEIQNIKNDYEDNKTSRINNLKKELSQNIINTTDKQILEELNKEENISYGTARRYYDDIRPFIDDCKYKELITGRIIN